MPKSIGPAVTIVGPLVIGQAAADAGIVSNFVVIIVAGTAIASSIFPEYNFSNPVRIIRLIILLVAAFFGIFGIFLALVVLTLHLCSLRSFGIPYMYPLAPLSLQGMKDSLIRAPLKSLNKRPSIIAKGDLIRENAEQGKIEKIVEKENRKKKLK